MVEGNEVELFEDRDGLAGDWGLAAEGGDEVTPEMNAVELWTKWCRSGMKAWMDREKEREYSSNRLKGAIIRDLVLDSIVKYGGSKSPTEVSSNFPMASAATTKILVIGGTGSVGKFMVEASAKAGCPTLALVRESTLSNPAKSPIIEKFKSLGVNFVLGDIHDHESLVKAIKQVDVVISTVSYLHLPDQYKIISAIKEAGNIKRFFPSEFGNDVDRANGVDEAKKIFETKAQIRRTIEAEGIPHTYVAANFFAEYFLTALSQPGAKAAPRDKINILGDGNPKAIFNTQEDAATYTIKAVDDPRTLNKILYIRPPANTLSFNEVVSLWEKKIGKTLERVYVPEEQVLKQIQESSFPKNMTLSMLHATYVKGDHTNYEIDPSFGVEATELYPDVNYTTVDEFLDRLV